MNLEKLSPLKFEFHCTRRKWPTIGRRRGELVADLGLKPLGNIFSPGVRNLHRRFREATSNGITSVRTCAQARSSFDVTSSPSNILYNLPQSTTRTGIVKSLIGGHYERRRSTSSSLLSSSSFAAHPPIGYRDTEGSDRQSDGSNDQVRPPRKRVYPWGGCKRGARIRQASISGSHCG